MLFMKDNQKILPDRVFQILITEKNSKKPQILRPLENNINSLKSIYPNSEYHIYEDEEIVDVIKENFAKDVIEAYTCLIPFAFKADLARYCLLYKYGGLYSDLSYLHLGQISLEKRLSA